jgi:hypothetical protein
VDYWGVIVMNDITYILPTRIESQDRLRNIITSVTYLLKNFPSAKVLVKEVDKQSVFSQHALPIIQNFVDTSNLRHIFEESAEDIFHKTRYLNDLILEADTEIVVSHDVDVIYPVSSHKAAYSAIKGGECDVVYPYGCGVYQFQVNYSKDTFEKFLTSEFDLDIILPFCRTEASTIGWTQFYNRKKVIEGFMWNESFLSWGAEDCEFYYRFNALGYRVGRIDSSIWHFEHARTHNSHYNNPKFVQNHNLWQWIRNQDSNMLKSYYENQPYVKRRQSDAGI